MSRSSFRTGAEMNMKKKGQRAAGILAVLLAFVFVLGAMPVPVWADEGGFTTDSFNVTVETEQNHVFHVSEEITVDFSAPRHGLYRYIPDGDRYYSVENIRVAGYEYDVYSESGNKVVQIGSADRYVNGVQTYRITYDIVGFLDDDETRDMLSIDLLPTGWSTPIQSADLTLTLPREVKDLTFYAGGYGSTESTGDYFDTDVSGTTIHAQSRQVLPKGVGLTVSADLPQGYWVDPASRDDDLPAMYGGVGVMGMLMLLLWLFVGRDDPVIKTVEFYPPEDMDPLEVAYIANDNVATKDLSALFMYFANRGYVKISSDDQKHFSITRIKDIDLAEPIHARQVFNGLFAETDTVSLDDLPSSFGGVAASIKREVVGSLDQRKINFSPVSRMGRLLGLMFCFFIPVAAGLCHSFLSYDPVTAFIGLISGIFILILMTALVARTDAFRTRKRPVGIIIALLLIIACIGFETSQIMVDYPVLALIFAVSTAAAVVATIFVRRRMNNELYGRVLGFRDFIKTAEYDRLKMLSDEDPEYYFNILPYAYIFGMSTKWADKFADFKIPQPSWYDGAYPYDPLFGHRIFVFSGNGLNSAVSSYHQQIGSDLLSGALDSGTGGGGGFGGGGFSGGGFGGGGGGSW